MANSMKGDKELFRERMLERYHQAIATDLPALADARDWPVCMAHEFEQIILDTICKHVWQHKIATPAATFMRNAQLRRAVYLAEDIVTGTTALEPLYEQSLCWRQQAMDGNIGS